VVLVLLIGLLLVGASVSLALRAVAMPRLEAAARLGQIRAYGFTADEVIDGDANAANTKPLDKLATTVGRVVASRWVSIDEGEIRKVLMMAGLYTTSPTTFLGYRALSAATLPLAVLWYLMATGAGPAMFVFGLALGALAGWALPMTILQRRARKRFQSVERDLPELIDLLVVTVEGGMGFNSSMQITSQKMRGALGDEIRLTLQEQRMGLSTTEALSNLLVRCDTPSMRSFVRSVLQGETLGVSIGQIMRALALEMRKRRRAAAEARAQKAPIKLLFPLVFLIFPSMFVVLLFPSLYTFFTTFGGN
jgi:tight adherence protein C